MIKKIIKINNYKLEEVYHCELFFEQKNSDTNFETISYYVNKAEAANLRHAFPKVKTRGEVSGGGRKIRKQKGTGFARQSSIRAPHWVGGGIVFGPNGRIHQEKINKKVRKKVLTHYFFQNLDQYTFFDDALINYKTKEFRNIFLERGVFIHDFQEYIQTVRNFENLKIVSFDKILCRYFTEQKKIYFTFSALEKFCSMNNISLTRL